MKTNEYLYGEQVPMDVPKELIINRVALLYANLNKLMNVHYMERDTERVNNIIKGIVFWETINEH